MFDDDVTPSAQIALGAKLDALSIGDLEERAIALKAEIARVEAELESKRAGLAAAEAVFGKA
ncbi:MAG: DUF1192 domain-containing protein [Caulobacterales bacterium]|nr:DUF1192 domain-containing protein [Caulobacterales bacterium]